VPFSNWRLKCIVFASFVYVRFQILTAVKMSMLDCWVVTPRRLQGRYQRFGGIYCHHLQDSMFLRRTGIYLQATQRHNTEYKLVHWSVVAHSAWMIRRSLHSFITSLFLTCIVSLITHLPYNTVDSITQNTVLRSNSLIVARIKNSLCYCGPKR
jgi:hypothetical protein